MHSGTQVNLREKQGKKIIKIMLAGNQRLCESLLVSKKTTNHKTK
jgi:hypothetical protein